MAVLVELSLEAATQVQIGNAEMIAMRRGQRTGGPPYDGCIFVAVTPEREGMRFTSAWRTEAAFRVAFDIALGPDLVEAGLTPGDPVVCSIVSMAVPGAHPA